jgi:hypothetical protein
VAIRRTRCHTRSLTTPRSDSATHLLSANALSLERRQPDRHRRNRLLEFINRGYPPGPSHLPAVLPTSISVSSSGGRTTPGGFRFSDWPSGHETDATPLKGRSRRPRATSPARSRLARVGRCLPRSSQDGRASRRDNSGATKRISPRASAQRFGHLPLRSGQEVAVAGAAG